MPRRIMRLFESGGLAAIFLLLLAGCSAEDYQQQADSDVYEIIDDGWRADYGPQSNYIINDVAGGPGRVVAAGLIAESGKLSLAEAVRLATLGSRDYQSQKETLYRSALTLTSARHEFEPQLFGFLGSRYRRSDSDESLTGGAQLGFTQTLATGADISLAIATDWLRYLTGDPRTSLGSVLNATVRQPLLRGAGQMIAQENLTQAQRNTIYALRSFARYRKSFVVSVVTQYYQVLQARDGVTNARNNYERLTASENRQVALADAQRLARFEVEQAQQQTLVAYDGYIQAVQSYEASLDNFKLTLGVSPEISLELDPCELSALGGMGITDPNFDVDLAIVTAMNQRLDLRTAFDRVDDAERQVMVAKDALQADLSIVGSSAVGSEGSTDFGQLRFDEGDYAVGFDLDLGLDRLNERNLYRLSLISLDQQQRSYQQSIDEVMLAVRQAYRDLRQAAARYQIQQLSLQLAMRRVENTDLLIQAGRATTRDVLDAQASLLSAQNSRTSALVSYVTASLRFARDVGTLEIEPDGTWVDRSPAESISAD